MARNLTQSLQFKKVGQYAVGVAGAIKPWYRWPITGTDIATCQADYQGAMSRLRLILSKNVACLVPARPDIELIEKNIK